MEYVRDLEREEEAAREREKGAELRRERKNREAFCALLQDRRSRGLLTARTHWRDFAESVRDEDAYRAVCTNLSGSRPKELFADVVEDMADALSEEKGAVRTALRAAGAEEAVLAVAAPPEAAHLDVAAAQARERP